MKENITLWFLVLVTVFQVARLNIKINEIEAKTNKEVPCPKYIT